MFSVYILLKFQVCTFPGTWVGWLESIIRLISAKAEAEASLGLAELGNYMSNLIYIPTVEIVES